MSDKLYSGFWPKYYDSVYPVKYYKDRAKLVISLLKKFNPRARNMLELACGSGNYTLYFSKKYSVIATDLSKDMLALAKKKCKNVKFSVMPMEKISFKSGFDIISCMWESFRYHKSYKSVKQTLSKIYKALRKDGLFVVDFHYFPPSKNTIIEGKVINVDGLKIKDKQLIFTKGCFDVRKSTMTIDDKGKIKNLNLLRSPLLRISESKMKSLFKDTGFKVVHFQRHFHDKKESMLFVAKKI